MTGLSILSTNSMFITQLGQFEMKCPLLQDVAWSAINNTYVWREYERIFGEFNVDKTHHGDVWWWIKPWKGLLWKSVINSGLYDQNIMLKEEYDSYVHEHGSHKVSFRTFIQEFEQDSNIADCL